MKGLVIAAVAIAVPGMAIAQGEVASQETANAGIPEEIPVEAFSGQNELSSAQLSESGNRFAFASTLDGKGIILVVDADTQEPITRIDVGKIDDFNWFRWAGDDRILISMTPGTADDEKWTRSVLMAFDIPTKKFNYIGFKRQGFEGDDLLYVDPAGQYVLLSVSQSIFEYPEVWRFPLDESSPDKPERVQRESREVQEWWADNAGVVRLGMSWNARGTTNIYYRSNGTESFRRIVKLSGDDEDGMDAWDVMGIYAGRDIGYAMVDEDDGRTVLREIDYSTGTLGKVVYDNPDWSVDSAFFRRGEGPIGASYTDDEPRMVWLDPEMAKVQSALDKALPGSRVRILDRAGMDRMLVLQTGPADPGALYVFTPKEKRLDLFANMRSSINERLLAPTSAEDITARDGTRLRAYLTLPVGRQAKGLPLIVMPHGGPYGVRDDNTYDDWTQLLANRGYAVLRVNFRGSGGYGEAFERLGDGQIGRAMQDDLDDATQWAIDRGTVDAARVCLMGASYGGYAAMWGAIRNPERYRCAASFAGVVDWEDLLKYDKNYLGSGRRNRRWYKDIWRPRISGDDAFDLASISVSDQIGRLTRPVLVAHGKEDERVPFKQYEQLTKAAREKGISLQTLELDDGHHLADPEQHAKFLTALVDFLEKNNPAD